MIHLTVKNTMRDMSTHCMCNEFPGECNCSILQAVVCIDSYLGLSQVSQSEVKSPEVVEDLGWNVGLHLLLQDAGGCAVCRQRSLNISLLQNLSQLDPGLHVVWVLLGYLLQMTLGSKDMF